MARKWLYAAALGVSSLGLVSCETVPTGPRDVADQTILDERAALAVELAYRAAGTALEIAVDAGALTGENAAAAARLENRAYTAVLAVRAAYDTGNASTYAEAVDSAQRAVSAVLAAVKGE